MAAECKIILKYAKQKTKNNVTAFQKFMALLHML